LDYCSKCGMEVKRGDCFCPGCGHPQEKDKRSNYLYVAAAVIGVAIISLAVVLYFTPVSAITMDKSELTLTVGEEAEVLSVAVEPFFAIFSRLTWKSSNPEVAIVSENGKVEPLSEGETTITVKAKDSDHVATCQVTVEYPTVSWDGGNYTGRLKDNIPHGKGSWNHPNGDSYVGEWKDGEKHGYGTYIWGDDSDWTGDSFEGEWRNGELFRGVYTWANGEIYDGELKDGKGHGYGKVYYANGDVYEGEWNNGKRDGQGIYQWANGDKYEGEWKLDDMDGQGTYYYANGDIYEGEWKEGSRHGQGKLAMRDGREFRGAWENDVFVD